MKMILLKKYKGQNLNLTLIEKKKFTRVQSAQCISFSNLDNIRVLENFAENTTENSWRSEREMWEYFSRSDISMNFN